MTCREMLTQPRHYYVNCDPTKGNEANDGLTPDTPLPSFQDVVSRLYQLDLGYQPIVVSDVPTHVDPGFGMSGPMIGQAGDTGLLFDFQGKIIPKQQHAGFSLAAGASCSIQNIYIDGTVQGVAGAPQDLFMMSNSRVIVYGRNNTFLQYTSSYNCITLVNSDFIQECRSFGSQIPNGAGALFGGVMQCGFQTDQGANIFCTNNDAHGLIAYWTIGTDQRSAPQFASSFFDLASGVGLLTGVDFHQEKTGLATGRRARLRKFATLDLNLNADPGQFNNIFGNSGTIADTASAQGVII
jgi:hypothetical protein